MRRYRRDNRKHVVPKATSELQILPPSSSETLTLSSGPLRVEQLTTLGGTGGTADGTPT
jgi:hypothetical protein